MTNTQQDRKNRLMPNGIPRWIRVWDTGPDKEIERYTVVFSGRYRTLGLPRHAPVSQWGWFQYVGMSKDPSIICSHGESQNIIDCPNGWTEQIGRTCRHNPNLGRRIRFEDLPKDCQTLVLSDYHEIWSIPNG